MAVIENYCCTGCGCLCDDLTLTTDGDKVIQADRACGMAHSWLMSLRPITEEFAEVDGQRTSWRAAIERSAAILRSARNPLVFGLSRTDIDSQRAAVRLADTIGATLDVDSQPGQHACLAALQEVGQSACSLGELEQRCDLVILWRADPIVTHPRLIERFLSGVERRILVVGDTPTETSRAVGHFLSIDRNADLHALAALRQMLTRQPTIADAAIHQLGDAISGSRCGVILFDTGVGAQPAGVAVVKCLCRLVADLNATRRFYALPLGSTPNLAGAEAVIGWQAGYPGSVNFGKRSPRHRFGEFTAADLLKRSEPDACMIVGSEAIASLPQFGQDHLAKIPTIIIDSEPREPDFTATVRFRTARAGVHSAGTAFRLDHVPLPLRPVFPSSIGTEAAVLTAIADRVADRQTKTSAATDRGT